MFFVFPGNAETLKHEPKKQKIDVYKRLREFWKRYYSAHYMTLAVQSKGMCPKFSLCRPLSTTEGGSSLFPFIYPCQYTNAAFLSHRELGHSRKMGEGDLLWGSIQVSWAKYNDLVPSTCFLFLTVFSDWWLTLSLLLLLFSAQPQPNFSDLLDPFDTPSFNKLYRGITANHLAFWTPCFVRHIVKVLRQEVFFNVLMNCLIICFRCLSLWPAGLTRTTHTDEYLSCIKSRFSKKVLLATGWAKC